MLKNFVIQFGEIIINTLVIVGLLISVVAGFSAMAYSFIGGLITLITGVVLFALVIYLLIDIRDSLKILDNK